MNRSKFYYVTDTINTLFNLYNHYIIENIFQWICEIVKLKKYIILLVKIRYAWHWLIFMRTLKTEIYRLVIGKVRQI